LIDLHTHTTASDGRCTPDELVRRAADADVTTLAVTDHDTVAACAEASRACAAAHITFVPGIEITAIREGADVHVLGYLIDVQSHALLEFLATQRRQRIERVQRMIDLLARQGIHLDATSILKPGLDDEDKAVGRPWIARALVEAGHVATSDEAFDRWLARGRSAFVPRAGAPPNEVIARIHAAGGIASLAHPALVARDEWIDEFVRCGLDAIEAYHSEHGPDDTARYLNVAARLNLAVSGGSDFHGDPSHGPDRPGAVSLPREDYDRLIAIAARLKPRAPTVG
jgi:predicted metal-dependent phosphoesterase TrpH